MDGNYKQIEKKNKQTEGPQGPKARAGNAVALDGQKIFCFFICWNPFLQTDWNQEMVP